MTNYRPMYKWFRKNMSLMPGAPGNEIQKLRNDVIAKYNSPVADRPIDNPVRMPTMPKLPRMQSGGWRSWGRTQHRQRKPAPLWGRDNPPVEKQKPGVSYID